MTFTTCIEALRAAYLNELAEEWMSNDEPPAYPASVAAPLANDPGASITHPLYQKIAAVESYAYANPQGRPAVEPASVLMLWTQVY